MAAKDKEIIEKIDLIKSTSLSIGGGTAAGRCQC